MKRCAILPVKRLSDAKSRLAATHSPEQRRALALALLEHTLGAVTHCPGIDEVLVTGADPQVADRARAHGARFLAESQTDGLNGALARAVEAVRARGVGAVLILPADLPLLRPADLAEAIRIEPAPPFLVIFPDRHARGTNLLYFAPPESFPYQFGTDSFARHTAAAEAAGYRVETRENPNIALDIDTPEDLAAAAGQPNAAWLTKGRE